MTGALKYTVIYFLEEELRRGASWVKVRASFQTQVASIPTSFSSRGRRRALLKREKVVSVVRLVIELPYDSLKFSVFPRCGCQHKKRHAVNIKRHGTLHRSSAHLSGGLNNPPKNRERNDKNESKAPAKKPFQTYQYRKDLLRTILATHWQCLHFQEAQQRISAASSLVPTETKGRGGGKWSVNDIIYIYIKRGTDESGRDGRAPLATSAYAARIKGAPSTPINS